MTYRVLYQIESYTAEGDLLARTYARNRKAADRAARKMRGNVVIRAMQKSEHAFVRPEWVRT